MFLSWDEIDQAKALAWSLRQRQTCPGCDTRKSEWDADPFAYVGEIDRCPGCELLAQEEDNLPEGKGARGMRRYLVPRHLVVEPAEEG